MKIEKNTHEHKGLWWISVIALILSLAAIALAWVRCEPFTWDWGSFVIGVLAILTAVVIAWQILQSITLERRIKSEVEKAKNELKNATELLKTLSVPPYFDVRIIEYVDVKSLDGFKDDMYTAINGLCGEDYGALDTFMHTRFHFKDTSKIEEIREEIKRLKGEYWKKVKFEHNFILP